MIRVDDLNQIHRHPTMINGPLRALPKATRKKPLVAGFGFSWQGCWDGSWPSWRAASTEWHHRHRSQHRVPQRVFAATIGATCFFGSSGNVELQHQWPSRAHSSVWDGLFWCSWLLPEKCDRSMVNGKYRAWTNFQCFMQYQESLSNRITGWDNAQFEVAAIGCHDWCQLSENHCESN